MKNTYAIEIDAPPADVFYFLEDGERLKDWLPNLVEHEDLEITENKVGSTARQVFLEGGRRMEMIGTTTAFEANRRLAAEVSGDAFDLMVDYELEDLDGRTRVRQDSELRFKGFLRFVGPIMIFFTKKSAEKHLAETFGKLKVLAEARGERVEKRLTRSAQSRESITAPNRPAAVVAPNLFERPA